MKLRGQRGKPEPVNTRPVFVKAFRSVQCAGGHSHRQYGKSYRLDLTQFLYRVGVWVEDRVASQVVGYLARKDGDWLGFDEGYSRADAGQGPDTSAFALDLLDPDVLQNSGPPILAGEAADEEQARAGRSIRTGGGRREQA
eukprot:CAMPEP_0114534378 /NCGR_PEP_ID=MMETSP0109-20121206/27805_1 /TAXON_ID=29199 /ORGANISM="Chlorarachnion reptans, Strain CCCM449" /LENGTH=140 /DNA_ID=CAMNT_0001717781 /DNA_START=719 /DNA_END=1139 /DNA_ORIENTATION=-